LNKGYISIIIFFDGLLFAASFILCPCAVQ
jgi:hypothetical protein